ncbi:HAD family hydrolase [Paenibacillus chartarius]|uniref:HAD family hydrolase n=1 Tax=Paenibacillus chartarius TaxID=747481 RepID=A0ABV6DVN2_9BACL
MTELGDVLFDQTAADRKVKGAFIFDMDGVIIDSEPLHFEADRLTMERFGQQVEQEDLEKYVGMTNPEMWQLIREAYGMMGVELEELLACQKSIKLERLFHDAWEPIEGIMELLVSLHDTGVPMAVASSSPRWFIEGVLTRLGIASYFTYIISGEEVERGKPSPDIYLEAARFLGVKPEHCMVLEDSRNGVIAAKTAGMSCIGFVNPNSGQQDLSLADYTVRKIIEVRKVILEG